jgi:murein DD-endopeptidase MepM/ murein hydrolase activator NlpD
MERIIKNKTIFFLIFFFSFIPQLSYSDWCHDFLHDLKFAQEGEEIKALQIALQKEGLFKEFPNGYFGPSTQQAVKLFQEKYKNEILIPLGLKKGNYFVGHATRSKLNELYGCTKISISSFHLQLGDTLFIKIEPKTEIEKISAKLGSREIIFSKVKENFVGLLGISIKEKPGSYDLVIQSPQGIFLKKKIKISERKFPVSTFPQTKEYSTPKKVIEEINKTSSILKEAFGTFTEIPYFSEPFIYPLNEIEISGLSFGEILKSKNYFTRHFGVDLKASTGTPVFAINDGLVIFSDDLGNYGKTLIIDHGLGIVSFYSHLSELKFKKGDFVKRGEIIGLAGATGYATAPHLHLSIRIKGISVDPLKFIETLQKGMIK